MNIPIIPLMAVVGTGESVIKRLFVLLMIVLAGLVLWVMGRWLIPKFGAAAMVLTVWDALFVLFGGLLIIDFFLAMAGHGFLVSW